MKKIILISFITLIFGLIFYIFPDKFNFLWGFQILLIPLIVGIFLVLVQKENKSYNFLPKLIIASLLTSFTFSALLQFVECFNYNYGPHCHAPSLLSISQFSLFLSAIFIFGGLIGIIIRGTTLLLGNKNKQTVNMKKIK